MPEDDLISPSEPPERLPPSEAESQFFQMISYQAPLPPPGMLEEYERVLPGAADRIFNRMERQSEHRQGLEKNKLEANIASEKRGQIFGFLLAAAAISGSFILIWTGKSVSGITLFITTFASLVGVFVIGKVKQSQEMARKRQDMKELMLGQIREESEEDSRKIEDQA